MGATAAGAAVAGAAAAEAAAPRELPPREPPPREPLPQEPPSREPPPREPPSWEPMPRELSRRGSRCGWERPSREMPPREPPSWSPRIGRCRLGPLSSRVAAASDRRNLGLQLPRGSSTHRRSDLAAAADRRPAACQSITE